jgi:hypothetical protein
MVGKPFLSFFDDNEDDIDLGEDPILRLGLGLVVQLGFGLVVQLGFGLHTRGRNKLFYHFSMTMRMIRTWVKRQYLC